MDLMHNVAFRIVSGDFPGIYRVILHDSNLDKLGVVRLDPPADARLNKGRRRLERPKHPRKKPAAPLTCEIVWMGRDDVLSLNEGTEILTVELEKPVAPSSDKAQVAFERRKMIMAPFLDPDHLREQILVHSGMAGLVKEAIALGASRTFVYKSVSLLCRFGFHEDSLRLGWDNCGAPGIPRPCDPGGRRKAGRKTNKQRIAKQFDGTVLPPDQPGMSSEWRAAILAADNLIPAPKPKMPERCVAIIGSHFVKKFRQENGELIPIDPAPGTVPNNKQIQRVLESELPRLQRLLEATTKGHFNRSLRRLVARNWQGVSGPGHTWAIDSTIGDIYLRSSINRAWIVGRPVVYIIVDVWSTAIVGFYVCLTGPSWDTAKVSLFSAGAPPELLAELWGYEAMVTLDPCPTMPSVLLCDRGEYLSAAARQTGAKLVPCMSYTPPYRPDLKGLVEVLHRIAKDKQYFFVPGAIDQRRAEFELRRFNPDDAVLTVREYVAYLHTIFSEYNLTAPRDKRVDVHMKGAGVFPSPAGLWRWGHEMGIGVRRHVPLSQLVTDLLPADEARVTRRGIMLGGREYRSDETDEQHWTALARNFGGWNISANHFPGSVSRIWTPNPGQSGVLDLRLSDHSTASPECTLDEVMDAFAVASSHNTEVGHQRLHCALESRRKAEALIERAKRLTVEALEHAKGPVPNQTEARRLETATPGATTPSEAAPAAREEAHEAYRDMMKALLAASNVEGGSSE